MSHNKSGGIDGALLAELKGRLAEISDLAAAASVLSWDEAVHMPPPAPGRAGGRKGDLPPLRTKKQPIRLWDACSISSQPQLKRCLLTSGSRLDPGCAAGFCPRHPSPCGVCGPASEHGSASYNA